ncbi:hypothetical protein C1I92_17120 [Jiangella anatolica]|uniref:HTH tetR-type domain-containing protein n=1 Tax=Jiangella anatolica TaxID=2670374 RepID=A0A2W2BQ55_9ACTN|nr:hypothetical protein C1I92_17120 [Jiangella anatolica]
MGASGQRTWGSSVQRRRDIVDAAARTFEADGYQGASIGDVAVRAGVSTGSLYHHFGGKADLFVAAWESHQDRYEERVADAVRGARRSGDPDPLALLEVGTRVYLRTVWEHRGIEAVYRGIDVPAELATAQRRRTQRWVWRNLTLLGWPESAANDLRVAILTAAIGEVAERVVACGSDAEVETLVDVAMPVLVAIVRG